MSGLSPTAIPMGAYRMRMLQVLNTRTLNPLSDFVAAGKYAGRFHCSANTTATILWNHIFRNPNLPGVLRIGKLKDYKLEQGIYQDNRDSVIIDYTDDIATRCPNYDFINFVTHGTRTSALPVTTKEITKNFFPHNQNIGGLRLVGRDSDGAGIYLGKMFMRDLETKQFGFLAYFSILNNDKDVCPNFKHGDTLPPLVRGFSKFNDLFKPLPRNTLDFFLQETGYSYKTRGAWTTIRKLLPRNTRHGGALYGELLGNLKLWQRYREGENLVVELKLTSSFTNFKKLNQN